MVSGLRRVSGLRARVLGCAGGFRALGFGGGLRFRLNKGRLR